MNRRMRNRTYGGVGGRRGQPLLLPDAIRVSPELAAGQVPSFTAGVSDAGTGFSLPGLLTMQRFAPPPW